MKNRKALFFLVFVLISPVGFSEVSGPVAKFMQLGMPSTHAFAILQELTSIGARPTGSDQAAKAVNWGKKTMESLGFQNVRLEPVKVEHWVRGDSEEVFAKGDDGKKIKLSALAIGLSVATPEKGITAEVVEVDSFEDLTALGEGARGKIIFFNIPMDASLYYPFEAYGKANDQRTKGPSEAVKLGAVAVLTRSLTEANDDVPHTGSTKYEDGVARIPCAALGIQSAEKLSKMLRSQKNVRVTMKLHCQYLPEVDSANVVGELVGSEKPNEVVLIGGHLDSWDVGTGAHDDGAGCAHVLEALNLIHKAGFAPKRTIRVVLFMNEESGLRGGKAYAAMQRPAGEIHVAAIESDSGGFSPRGFSVKGSDALVQRVQKWAPVLATVGAGEIVAGDAGSDVTPLAEQQGVPAIELRTDGQRYFDYHHSVRDTIENVNPRELELGAVSMATLAYAISEEGLQ